MEKQIQNMEQPHGNLACIGEVYRDSGFLQGDDRRSPI